jgi:hypothetical protein
MGKYQTLQNKVRSQNDMAKQLEDLEVSRLHKEQQEQAEEIRENQREVEQERQEEKQESKPVVQKQAAIPVTVVYNKQQLQHEAPVAGPKGQQATHERL